MKKQLVLIFAVLLILGFAASVYADTPVVASGDTQVTISGDLRVRGRIDHDMTGTDTTTLDNTDKNNNTRSRYDYRVRVGILAKLSPKTKGFVQFVNGTSGSHTTTVDASADAKGNYKYGNNTEEPLRLRNMWIEHTIADLLTIKVGHQPIKLGWGMFYDHSLYGEEAIVITVKPTKEFSIVALTSKLEEQGYSANDADLYALGLNVAPVKDTEISVDLAWLRDRYMTSGNIDAKLGNNLSGGNKRLSLYNLGARVKTKIAGLGLKGGVELQRGTLKDATGALTDIKFRGMAALLGASYDINPVTLDVELGYGSGDDNGTTDNKVKTFISSTSANTPYTYVYEDSIANATNIVNGGRANTMYAKLGATANPTKDLKVDLRYYYLKAAKAPKSTVSAERYGFANATDKKDIGHEVDAYITYKLDKGLNYVIEAGYLFAGDFWKAATNNPDDPWAFKHGLELEF